MFFKKPVAALIAVALMVAAFTLRSIPFAVIGLLMLFYFAINFAVNIKILKSDAVSLIAKLNRECEIAADSAKNSTNYEKRYKVREFLKEKDGIIDLLSKDKDNIIKQKVARQAVELTTAYVKMVEEYFSRNKETDESKVEKLKERIEKNREKIKSAMEVEAQQDLNNTINIDEKLLAGFLGQKDELDKIKSKLDYMESTIKLLKQQMFSSVENENVLNDVQNILNETIALDNVINNRKRERI